MFERFTDRARRSLQLANQEAQRLNHDEVSPAHILFGLFKEGSGVAASVLKNLGMDFRTLRNPIEKLLPPPISTNDPQSGRLPHTAEAKKVFERAIEEAKCLSHNYVGTEHLLLGIIADGDSPEAVAVGLKAGDVRQAVLELVAPKSVTDHHESLSNLATLLAKANAEGTLETLQTLLVAALAITNRVITEQSTTRIEQWRAGPFLVVTEPPP